MTNRRITATSWTADRETREGPLSRKFTPRSECLKVAELRLSLERLQSTHTGRWAYQKRTLDKMRIIGS